MSNNNSWDFGNTGNLTLPAGGTITEGVVTDNPTIELTPANPDDASQKLVIKGGLPPEEPADYHLHLTTGDLDLTSIILGTDYHNVRTTTDGKIQITTPTEGTNVWEFDTTGALTFPDDTVQTTAWTGAATQIANGTSSVVVELNGNINFTRAGYNYGHIGSGVALGYLAGNTNQGLSTVAIGTTAGQDNQGLHGVAIGTAAGYTGQSGNAVAIGNRSGQYTQGQYAVAIGALAGNTNQGGSAVAVGSSAGATAQGISAVAVGSGAAFEGQGNSATALGASAASYDQNNFAIAIGAGAGYSGQGTGAIAIGADAATLNQGEYSIAIGAAISTNAIQPNNSIIIDATASQLAATGPGLFISPVRQDDSNIANIVYYNTSTKEITYSSAYGNTEVNAYLQQLSSIAFVASPATISGVQNFVTSNANVTSTLTAGSINVAGDVNLTGAEGSDTARIFADVSGTDTSLVLEVGDDSADSIVLRHYSYAAGTTLDMLTATRSSNIAATVSVPGNITATGTITGNVLKIEDGVHEAFQTKADATGVVEHDCSQGHIFYHTSPDANWTANFANLNLGSGYATSVSLIITQGGTGYYPNVVQIGGAGQTINWQGNTLPTPSTNRTDVATFSIINNSSTYTVLGQLTGF
jgi:hypothetical protein